MYMQSIALARISFDNKIHRVWIILVTQVPIVNKFIVKGEDLNNAFPAIQFIGIGWKVILIVGFLIIKSVINTNL
jgi:hypothetical protein